MESAIIFLQRHCGGVVDTVPVGVEDSAWSTFKTVGMGARKREGRCEYIFADCISFGLIWIFYLFFYVVDLDS